MKMWYYTMEVNNWLVLIEYHKIFIKFEFYTFALLYLNLLKIKIFLLITGFIVTEEKKEPEWGLNLWKLVCFFCVKKNFEVNL